MDLIDFEREKRKQNRNKVFERSQKLEKSIPSDAQLEKLKSILEQKRSARLSVKREKTSMEPNLKSHSQPQKSIGNGKWDEFELTCQEIEKKIMIA